MATWADVRKLALAMPSAVEERSRDGRCAWCVDDKFFVWERPLRKSDLKALGDRAPKGEILGVRTDGLEMKEVILLSSPRTCFTIPHFDGYPAVLVLLNKISAKNLKALIVEAWLSRAPKRIADEYLHGPRQSSRRSRGSKAKN